MSKTEVIDYLEEIRSISSSTSKTREVLDIVIPILHEHMKENEEHE